MATSVATALKKSIQIRSKVVLIRHSHFRIHTLRLEGGGGGWSSRPLDKGGWSPKKCFPPFGPLFGLQIRGSRPPGPSPGSATDSNPFWRKLRDSKGVGGMDPRAQLFEGRLALTQG